MRNILWKIDSVALARVNDFASPVNLQFTRFYNEHLLFITMSVQRYIVARRSEHADDAACSPSLLRTYYYMGLVTESPKHLVILTTIHIADTKTCSVVFNSEQVEKLVSKRQSAPFAVATPTVVAPSNLAETAGPHTVSRRNWPNSVP